MPKRKVHNFQTVITINDGSVIITEKDWMSAPQVFYYEDNKELIDDYARRTDDNFRARETAKQRFEHVENRRQYLQQEQAKIQSELVKLL